ncbi:MAG: ATP-binding protein [Chitinophagales bacterium]
MPQKALQNKSKVSFKPDVLNELKKLATQIRVETRMNAARIQPLALRMIELARSIENKNYEGLANIELAHYVCSTENDYHKSVKLCDKGYNLTSGLFRKNIEPYYHLNKGRANQYLGEQINAQEEYLMGVRQLEFKNHLKEHEKRWLASTYYNLFILFNQEGVEFTQEEYLHKAFRLYESVNDKSGISNCFNSFAVFHYKKKEYQKSLEYLLKAYDFSKQSNAQTYLSIFCSNIGLVYSKMNRLSEGLQYFEEAKLINKEINSTFHTGHTFQQIGEAYYTNNEFEKALANYKKAEKIFLQIRVKPSLTTLFQYISDVYEKLGDFVKAFDYQKKYAATLIEHFNDEKTFAIAKARNQFELEKKDKEAKLLRQKNEEIETYATQLEVSNNQLKQFAHIASHDLKEPLRMVSSYAKLLERSISKKLDENEKEYLQFMVQGTITMQNLVNDLLTLSHINYVSDTLPVNLNKVMHLTLTNLDSSIKEKNAKITFKNLPIVNGEETQMLQLFQNLISNAIKYNENKTPTVKISCTKKKSFFEFTISDNGIGIGEEYREKVFQIFQRLHTRNEYSGTGIGLTICKKIIDQFGGKIWIESNNNGGSNFIFTLPAK